MKLQNPAHRVTVVERNRPFDTFGWGVVLSDQTLDNLQAADPTSAQLIGDAFNHWDDVEMFFKGRSVRSGGHGFCGIGRKRLLNILQDRCLELGVDLVFETDVTDDQAVAAQYNADLVIASDGLNSRIRTRYADTFRPDVELRNCRFVWLGTRKTFDAFTFAFEQTEHGWFAAHAYQFDATTSTFIVETPEAVWKAHGLDQMSQQDGIAFCERLFARYLDGHALMNNATHVRGSANLDPLSARGLRTLGALARPIARHEARARRADGRRGAHRAFFDWQRHQAGAGRRDRPGALICNAHDRDSADHDGGAAGLRSRALGRGAENPERRAQLDRVV